MGQKSLHFSVSKCFQTPLNSDQCHLTYHTTNDSCKLDAVKKEAEAAALPCHPSDTAPLLRFTTEQLNRWCEKLTKAKKIASRKQQDLRKAVLTQNALKFAKFEVRSIQIERQKRWRELKPLLNLEPTFNPNTHTSRDVEMVTTTDHQLVEDMDVERPSSPLPCVGAVKRHRCGCSSLSGCQCNDDLAVISKKSRPSEPVDDDDDLKSLDQFLSSLHCNSRQVG